MAKGKGGLNSPMQDAVSGPSLGGHHRGTDKAVYNHHICPSVAQAADIGPGDVDLKFFDVMDEHSPAQLNTTMGTAIPMGKKAK